MPAQPSQTRFCNAALVHLGTSDRLGAINEGTPLARVFEDVWDASRDEVLADHPWNFAVFREALAVSGDYVPAGTQYSQAYELPADCLRWLPWREDHDDYFEGEQEGQYLLSNAEAPIYARFIKRIADVSKWSPGFGLALSAKLAHKGAWAITGQLAMVDRMEALYEKELRRGKRQDGLATGDRRRHAEFRSDWLDSRNRSAR